ncbi:MAG: hypothetical protein I3273_06905 [Candidatus Moeniiplasma glomeromycotorum]|nr:hypothetical protein [Candidatus Moeniiplasma glomeromycotorum]MCE8168277.1 hypothetical protein [Candidatus Moeniiplasma glomeromycotorum]MCE8169815.1 hypothetical protein [Candidatus Moeniiplasma glomeromycotorum]
MVGRPKIIRTPEELKKFREKYSKYYKKYHKFYYLKKSLENPNYTRENYLKKKKKAMKSAEQSPAGLCSAEQKEINSKSK